MDEEGAHILIVAYNEWVCIALNILATIVRILHENNPALNCGQEDCTRKGCRWVKSLTHHWSIRVMIIITSSSIAEEVGRDKRFLSS